MASSHAYVRQEISKYVAVIVALMMPKQAANTGKAELRDIYIPTPKCFSS